MTTVGWRVATSRSTADELLADLVEQHLGVRPRIDRRCPRCDGTTHGRPRVEGVDVHVSLARAPGLAVAAVSETGPVGVDVEPAGRACFPGFAEVALHPAEVYDDPTATWVRKEALVKATGWGLTVDLRRVRLDPTPRLVAWEEELPAPGPCRIRDLTLPTGYVGAVAELSAPAAPAGRPRPATRR